MVELTGVCRRTGGGPEPALLARVVAGLPGRRFLELGAGCGQASVRLAGLREGCVIDALERQLVLVEEARLLVARYGVAVRVIAGDLRDWRGLLGGGCYDGVFFNPPYFEAGAHREPRDPLRAAARMTLHGGLDAFCAAAYGLVRVGGWVVVVYRGDGVGGCVGALQGAGFCVERQIVVETGGRGLVMMVARKGWVGPWYGCRGAVGEGMFKGL
ncbi:O-methyltransferase-like protein [Magnetococcus marinus MC-1]|uniref:O-methyltransferase-like protein n=1 Tax=Magnetococcus marinus (strain ATCC BAA-1437 / JCM 17883 / MC-1) TaxID=156889 RepID=A0LCS8_MAGMM|nr:O-methyltransferase-like protein [Magnetococcus marinus]ABK45771.1 O-methyltransferase-like protein [Magnetococcus marinus MC-1]